MKISVKDGKACEKILKVEIAEDRIQTEYDAFYKAVAPTAKIPGFRPGKAPRDVLVMHYGSQAKESVLKELITDSYQKALQEKAIEPLGYPEVEDVDFKDKSLSYKAKVEIRPKVKLSKVTGLKVKKEKTTVKPEELEDSLKRIQDAQAQYKAVEDRPAKQGDFVIADYVCECEGKEVDKRNDDWFELNEEKEFFSGFSKALEGIKPGESKEVKLTMPKDSPKKEIAGKEAVFKVKVKEIKTKTLPPLDDELAKSAGGDFKTLDELKEKIKNDLLVAKEKETETNFERALMDELIKQNKIELPEKLIERRQEQMASDMLQQYKQQGLPEDALKGMAEGLRKDLAPEARRQVHLAFVFDKVAEEQAIKVVEEDRQQKFEQMAEQIRQPLDVVKQYYASNEDRRYALDDQIRNEKVIQYIKDNAKIK